MLSTAVLFAAAPDVRVDHGVLIDSTAGYSFTLPAGWSLDDSSDGAHVAVSRGGSSAIVTVRYEVASNDPNRNPMTEAYIRAMGEESDFRPDGVPSLTGFGGQPGADSRGARTGKGGVRERVRILVTERPGHAVSLTATVAETEPKSIDAEIDQIVRTFKFGKPAKKP